MPATLDDWLKPLIKAVVQEVLSEVGQGSAPQLYDIDQAAKRLSVPKRWLYEGTSQGKIPFKKIGRYVRFSDSDLNEIMKHRI